MPKPALISISLAAVIFAVVIPFMEINSTHLINPHWPAHARLHEAWQLLTNAVLSVIALIIVWNGQSPRLGIVIALTICLSFMVSFLGGSLYGGSMLHSDGTQTVVGGINVGVAIVLLLIVLLVHGYWSVRTKLEQT